MPLTRLEGIEPSIANSALAATVISIGGGGLEHIPSEYLAISRGLIEEARSELGLRSDDESWEAYRKIKDFLSREVDRRLFAGIDRKALRRRMGEAGQLPLSGYEIKLGKPFKENFTNESSRFAISCVQKADLFEHFLEEAGDKDVQFSIFARQIESLKKDKTYWCIVSALRAGDTLEIMALWRIFPETVNLENVAKPLNILKSFVSVYGVELVIEGEQTNERLIVDQFFPGYTEVEKFLDSPDNQSSTMEIVSQKEVGGVRVALAYAISHPRYRADRTRYA